MGRVFFDATGTTRQPRRWTGWKRRPTRSGGAGRDGQNQQPGHGGTGDAGWAPARGNPVRGRRPAPERGSEGGSAALGFLEQSDQKQQPTAPTVAVTMEPSNPPAAIPSSPNKKPPTTAPITPTMILPNRPKPPPFRRVPANQPATAPMARKINTPVRSTAFLLSVAIHEKTTRVEPPRASDGAHGAGRSEHGSPSSATVQHARGIRLPRSLLSRGPAARPRPPARARGPATFSPVMEFASPPGRRRSGRRRSSTAEQRRGAFRHGPAASSPRGSASRRRHPAGTPPRAPPARPR